MYETSLLPLLERRPGKRPKMHNEPCAFLDSESRGRDEFRKYWRILEFGLERNFRDQNRGCGGILGTIMRTEVWCLSGPV